MDWDDLNCIITTNIEISTPKHEMYIPLLIFFSSILFTPLNHLYHKHMYSIRTYVKLEKIVRMIVYSSQIDPQHKKMNIPNFISPK